MNPRLSMEDAESILKVLSVPILVLDQSLGVVMANGAFYELMQIAPEKLGAKGLQEHLASSAEPQLQSVLKTLVVKGGEIDEEEIVCTIPPNIRKILSVSAHRIREEGEKSNVVLVELRDVTARNRATESLVHLNDALTRHGEELERINADLEAFNRWVSHDLRTPLRFANTIAEQLLDRHKDTLTADAMKSLQLILDSTHEMGRLIENLLAFVQIDRIPLKKRRVNTLRLVRETLKTLKDAQQGRSLDIRVDNLPSCIADRVLLKQVYVNLLSNALTFTQPRAKTEIHVGFEENDGVVTFFVRDNGVGFDTSQADAIFSIAQRPAISQHLRGTGIGLTLVKRIVERHGGRIWAEGEPSRGATFYFRMGE